jgi:predicted DNA binding CopG/RHH family protein
MKNHEIRVKLSDEQLQRIKRKAGEMGMQPSQFLRFLGLNATIRVSSGE